VARRERLVLAPLNLVEACQDSASMFRHLIPATIGVQVTTTEPIVLVKADRGSVDQILLNLVTNARDAMPDGGELRVEVSRSVVDGEADSPGAARAGEYGVLAVADTGVGMDEAVKSRLFEPFFTTKTREQGTGLGLSSVDGLVSQHQGFVKVESAPMRGTTVKVYLPIASAGAEPLEEPAPPPVHGGETILLVEDDPLILAIGRRVLERAGYLVLVATDGDKALDLLRAPGPPVHLVVSDVVMPNRTGPALLRAARTLERQPPFLFMSGYSDLGADDRAAIRDAGFIAKPWSVAGLLVKVREALDSRL